MQTLIIVLLSLLLIAAVIAVILLIKVYNLRRNPQSEKYLQQNFSEIKEHTAVVKDRLSEIRNYNELSQKQLRTELAESVHRLGGLLQKEQSSASDNTVKQLQLFESRLATMEQSNLTSIKTLQDSIRKEQTSSADNMVKQLQLFENRLAAMERSNAAAINSMQESVNRQMNSIREDNGKHLDEIRNTVDKKLQTSLEEKLNRSFETVSAQLERVYKGLGEMQTLASGVGDLKKVLSNVKSRGILGEMQLGNILSEILAPEQYDTNVITVEGSHDPVEYAIKLPGDGDKPVYLPIDSKFPGDAYTHYREACETADKELILKQWKELEQRLKKSAKDIHDKYVMPPYTTNFAIMFLPFEGLYAEAVDHGMVEMLQREYNINIAGPSTMAAMLNSLYMGFRTLAIQKRSSEVWNILGAVRGEFEKFNEALVDTQKALKKADDNLEKLVGARSRMMMRKLKDVETLDSDKSQDILGIDSNLDY